MKFSSKYQALCSSCTCDDLTDNRFGREKE